MSEYKKKFFWWWSWNSEKFENYLEKMSEEGWCVENTAFAHTVITFKKSQPKHIRYCVDYQTKYKDDYLNIVRDDGWNLISNQVGWTLWSKNYEEIRPSIFTDNQCLIDRNKRLLKFIGIISLLQLPTISSAYSTISKDGSLGVHKIYFVSLFNFLFLSYCLYKIYNQNKQLKA